MTKPNLTDEDYSDLAKLVREAIGAEPYPYRAAHQEIARAAGEARPCIDGARYHALPGAEAER
jgi:hypothetical protein